MSNWHLRRELTKVVPWLHLIWTSLEVVCCVSCGCILNAFWFKKLS